MINKFIDYGIEVLTERDMRKQVSLIFVDFPFRRGFLNITCNIENRQSISFLINTK